MKKFIVYVLFVFVCGISIYNGYRYKQSSEYEKTAVPYVRDVLPRISTWDPAQAQGYMAAEVLERVSSEELQKLMASLSVIGTLEGIDEISFKNKTSGEHITRKQQPLVTYNLVARYSSGEAKVRISLLDKGDSFAVYHFNFQSAALTQEGQ